MDKAHNEFDYSVKNIRRKFKENGVFYTSNELAEYMKSLLPPNVTEVYDPTCGNGNLLSVFDDSVKKYGQDIDREQIEQAQLRLTNFEGVANDTLKSPAFGCRKFKYIVANPPFSIKWEAFSDERFAVAPCLPPNGKADYAFILHILYYLSDDGIAVIMNFPGVLYRGQREGKIRKWLIESNYIEKVIAIPGNSFTDTKIETCIIVLNKSKRSTDVEFIDRETDTSLIVTIDEIREQDYDLSVNRYIIIEEVKEQIDPLILEGQARKHLIDVLKQELTFSKFVSEEENINFNELLDECEKIIQSFREE